jgi:hypothetical protein
MSSITVDLNARIVSDETKVFVVRPGRAFGLYGTFVKENVVAPELPLLQLTSGLPLGEHKDLDARIRRSRALRDWYRQRASHPEIVMPSLDLADYALSLGKRIGNVRSVLYKYFDELKSNDIILVPPSGYGQQAYIGEMADGPSDYVDLEVPLYYGTNPLTARKVHWLGEITKRKLATEILEALERPIAIYLLPKRLRAPIYDAAFGTYYDLSASEQDFSARFDLSATHFSTDIDFRLQAFFNAVASNIKAIDENRKLSSPHIAAFQELGDYAALLKSNVNSPGSLTLFAKRMTPVVAAALFTLAVQVGPEATSLATDGQIVIGNSKAPAGDQCTAMVGKSVLDQLVMLGLDNWPQACELARIASEASGATTTVKVKK